MEASRFEFVYNLWKELNHGLGWVDEQAKLLLFVAAVGLEFYDYFEKVLVQLLFDCVCLYLWFLQRKRWLRSLDFFFLLLFNILRPFFFNNLPYLLLLCLICLDHFYFLIATFFYTTPRNLFWDLQLDGDTDRRIYSILKKIFKFFEFLSLIVHHLSIDFDKLKLTLLYYRLNFLFLRDNVIKAIVFPVTSDVVVIRSIMDLNNRSTLFGKDETEPIAISLLYNIFYQRGGCQPGIRS